MSVDAVDVVREVWCEVLHVDQIASTDDFFDIGGHSLTAMQVARRLRDRLDGAKVPTRLLFQHSTLDAFIAAVNDRLNEVIPA